MVYSNFVKYVFKKFLDLECIAIPPPIDTNLYKPLKKDPRLILSVTRFHPDKELHIMAKWFTKHVKGDVRYIIAGRVLDRYYWYYQYLKDLARKDKRITIVPNPSEQDLAKLYGHAAIFWYIHQEHCATTPVEAMSAGAVPIILDRPGLREAILHKETGIIAQNKYEFIKWTYLLLEDHTLRRHMGVNAREICKLKFSKDAFYRKFRSILESLS